MDLHGESPEFLLAELERLSGELQRAVQEIAAALLGPPPPEVARLTGLEHRVQGLINRFFQVFPRIIRAQAGASARLAAAAPEGASRAQRTVLEPIWYTLTQRANQLRLDLNRWPAIRQMAADQGHPRRRPLLGDPASADPVLMGRLSVEDRLIAALHEVITPAAQDEGARDHGCFSDIELAHGLFLELAHAAYRLRLAQGRGGVAQGRGGAGSFLDIGCGSGIKMLAALGLFERATGIEYDPGYAAAARWLCDRAGHGAAQVIQADALTFEGYDAFDVIYFYRPMRDGERMEALERRICAQARPGTLLIAPYSGFAARHQALGCAAITGWIYMAGAEEGAARQLRETAELLGSDPPAPEEALHTLWTPILRASAANGHVLSRDGVLPRP